MWSSLVRNWLPEAGKPNPRCRREQGAKRTFRPSLEVLEDRAVPAIFTVTNLNDAGADSLREAITRANDEVINPGPDTIVFAPTVQGGTINLTTFTNLQASTPDVPQPAGPSAFLITSAITIQGTGETINRAVFASSAAFRLFRVTRAGNLTLQNLTLTNGLAQGGAGGTGGGGAAGRRGSAGPSTTWTLARTR